MQAGKGRAVPLHLRDGHYQGASGLGHGDGYRYPHNDPSGWVPQQYAPEDLGNTAYYEPTDHGFEAEVRRRLAALTSTGWHADASGGDTDRDDA